MRSYGLVVELPDCLVSGLIHVSALPDDFYQFDSTRLSFIGRRSRRTYKIGDVLQVIVSRVDAYAKRQIDFVPVDSGTKSFCSRANAALGAPPSLAVVGLSWSLSKHLSHPVGGGGGVSELASANLILRAQTPFAHPAGSEIPSQQACASRG